MMNTIEYRIDCQLLKYLHSENNLGCRFPIGKVDQVKQWPKEHVRAFWERWYFPANATLYLVGDMEEADQDIEAMIAEHFGHLPTAYETAQGEPVLPWRTEGEAGADGEARAPVGEAEARAAGYKERRRQAVRPPVQHVYGVGEGPHAARGTAPVKVFRHPLLQQFMLSVFCKMPTRSVTSMGGLRRAFIVRLILSVFQFRLNGRFNANAPFVSIELDSSGERGWRGGVVGHHWSSVWGVPSGVLSCIVYHHSSHHVAPSAIISTC